MLANCIHCLGLGSTNIAWKSAHTAVSSQVVPQMLQSGKPVTTQIDFSSKLLTTSFTGIVVVVTVGHLVLNKLALYLVAYSAHDTGEWLVNRMKLTCMFRVYLLVKGLLQMWQEIVVYPLVPPALLHVVDEPHQVLRLQHLLTTCCSRCVPGSCATLTQPQSQKLSNKVYNPRWTPPLAQTEPRSTCPRSFPLTCPSPQNLRRVFIL